jgi:hypothetical protein
LIDYNKSDGDGTKRSRSKVTKSFENRKLGGFKETERIHSRKKDLIIRDRFDINDNDIEENREIDVVASLKITGHSPIQKLYKKISLQEYLKPTAEEEL